MTDPNKISHLIRYSDYPLFSSETRMKWRQKTENKKKIPHTKDLVKHFYRLVYFPFAGCVRCWIVIFLQLHTYLPDKYVGTTKYSGHGDISLANGLKMCFYQLFCIYLLLRQRIWLFPVPDVCLSFMCVGITYAQQHRVGIL